MADTTVLKLVEYDRLNRALLSIQKELSETDAYKNYVTAEKLATRAMESCTVGNNQAKELIDNINGIQKQYEQTLKAFTEIVEVSDECIDEVELSYYLKKLSDLSKKTDVLIKQIEKLSGDSGKISKEYAENVEKLKAYRNSRATNLELFKQIKAEKDKEINGYQQKMMALAAELPKELVEAYVNLRKARKFPMLAKYHKSGKGAGNCGGCRMQVDISTDSVIGEVGYAFCPNCDRILYIE